MNLVQLAEQAKNLSNQQLQQMLQQPDGQMPPFLLAAEAARRQDIEQSAQAQQSDPTTVLDDLMQSRAQAAGVNALPNQMAQGMPVDQAPMMPPAPEEAPQQMKSGGIMSLRKFGTGTLITPPLNDFDRELMGAYNLNTVEELNQFKAQRGIVGDEPPRPRGMTPKPFEQFPDTIGVRDMTEEPKSRQTGVNWFEDQQEKMRLENMQENGYGVKALPVMPPGSGAGMSYTPNVPPDLPPKPSDNEATAKQLETAEKEVQMDAPPSATQPPTTGNAADEAALYKKLADLERSDTILGLPATAYSQIAAALLDTTPGRTKGQRWAAASGAVAAGMEEVSADERARQREEIQNQIEGMRRQRAEDLQMWRWNNEDKRWEYTQSAENSRYMDERNRSDSRYTEERDLNQERYDQARQDQIDAQKRADAAAARADTLAGHENNANAALELAKQYEAAAKNMLGESDNPDILKPESRTEYDKLMAAAAQYRNMYLNYTNQISTFHGVPPVAEKTDANGRPIAIAQ